MSAKSAVARDRVITVGDLVDRGPDSLGTLALIEEPWFHAVLGNHETMLLSDLGYYDSRVRARRSVPHCGGSWIRDAALRQRKLLRRLADRAATLPLSIRVDGDVAFNVMHGDLHPVVSRQEHLFRGDTICIHRADVPTASRGAMSARLCGPASGPRRRRRASARTGLSGSGRAARLRSSLPMSHPRTLPVNRTTEVELKFLVPATARQDLATEMARGSATLERTSLMAMYLDTPDRRLAKAGLAWRLRREGRRWVQTLKGGGSHALERFEDEVIRPEPTPDPSLHQGTPPGEQLMALLRRAATRGLEPGVRYRTEVRRTARRVRTKGAVVEVAFDEGRLLAADATVRIREIEFELVSGSAVAMLALAERWRKRFGLVVDPRSKAERGDRLAEGSPYPPVRKASPPRYAAPATAAAAFAAVLDECQAQITRNAIGLAEGDPALQTEHVHQLRVGIRRLRSALRSFEGWVPAPPPPLVEGLRALFAILGQARDSDVLDAGVVAELTKVGAPALNLPVAAAAPDPAAAIRAGETQALLLAWIAWRTGLDEPLPVQAAPAEAPAAATPPAGGAPSDDASAAAAEPAAPAAGPVDAKAFVRSAARRLRRWHARIAADSARFAELDEPQLHALRKRIKLQRYAAEFFAPVLARRPTERYLAALATIQDRMGELNDLFVARQRYQALVATEPAAWFALGWLAARIAEVRALAGPELRLLAKTETPGR